MQFMSPVWHEVTTHWFDVFTAQGKHIKHGINILTCLSF